jgi:hypothetical protein
MIEVWAEADIIPRLLHRPPRLFQRSGFDDVINGG